MDKIIIRTANAPAPIGPYSQAVLVGQTLYISGQICLDPVTGELKNKRYTGRNAAGNGKPQSNFRWKQKQVLIMSLRQRFSLQI